MLEKLNATHIRRELLLRAEDLCSARWPKPTKCSLRAIEVISEFMLKKLLTCCLLTPLFLLACSFAREELPWYWSLGELQHVFQPKRKIEAWFEIETLLRSIF